MAAPEPQFKELSIQGKQISFPVDPSLPPPPADIRKLYPEIEPYQSGHLNVGDGHEIYYEQCGQCFRSIIHHTYLAGLLFVSIYSPLVYACY